MQLDPFQMHLTSLRSHFSLFGCIKTLIPSKNPSPFIKTFLWWVPPRRDIAVEASSQELAPFYGSPISFLRCDFRKSAIAIYMCPYLFLWSISADPILLSHPKWYRYPIPFLPQSMFSIYFPFITFLHFSAKSMFLSQIAFTALSMSQSLMYKGACPLDPADAILRSRDQRLINPYI